MFLRNPIKKEDGQFKGYGDPECASCKLRGNNLCRAMVGWTNLQTNAAEEGNMDSAVIYEGLQNDVCEFVQCEPGFRRV